MILNGIKNIYRKNYDQKLEMDLNFNNHIIDKVADYHI